MQPLHRKARERQHEQTCWVGWGADPPAVVFLGAELPLPGLEIRPGNRCVEPRQLICIHRGKTLPDVICVYNLTSLYI